uniref:Protein SDA1 n=1 Tax=Opuntia streptacantha TaxID=393608 RepID=A0A7C9A3J5_OPUST
MIWYLLAPDAVEPLFKQIVNQFVHDRSRTELCPSLLLKKDRGQPTDPKARPKAYGEVNVAIDVPGAELLQQDDPGVDDASDFESDGISGSKDIESDDEAGVDVSDDDISLANNGSEDDMSAEDSEAETEDWGGSMIVEEGIEDEDSGDDEVEDGEELYSASESDGGDTKASVLCNCALH